MSSKLHNRLAVRKVFEETPLVSVIIPTKNSEDSIEKCLESLRNQSYKNVEIIVVDNYSMDKTAEIAKNFKVKIFSKGPERSAQVNFGAQKANGKYVYRVDSDFVLEPDVIREAVVSSENFGYDAVVVHNSSDPTISFWAKVRKAERDCYKNDELNVAARFWKKEVFTAVGGFDEALVAGDDYDLHNRLLRSGFKVGRIRAKEIHVGEPRTLADIVRKHYYYGKNIRRFIKKNPQKALMQLAPMRASYVKNITNFFSSPLLLVGFAVYQVARYGAVTVGIVTAKLEEL